MCKVLRRTVGALRLCLFLAAALAFVCGCGGGGGSSFSPAPRPTPSPSPGPEPVGAKAYVKYIFDLAQAKQVDAQVTIFEFRGYDSELSLIYGPVAKKRGSFNSDGSVVLSDVPISVKSLVVMMKDKDKNPCGLTQNNNVNLIAGQTAVISKPDFSSSANELGERLKSLTVSPASAALDIGKTVDFTASGVFKCNNGITLESDLTEVVVWRSADAGIAEAAAGGRFRAVDAGGVRIRAVLGKRSAEADLTVNAPSRFTADVHVSLKNAGLPSGVRVKARGYGRDNKLLLSEQTFSGDKALDFTLKNVNYKVARVALTVFAADGRLYAFKLADVALRYGKVCEVKGSGLAAGKSLLSKAKLTMEAEPQALELNKSVKITPHLQWTLIPGVYTFTQNNADYFSYSLKQSKTVLQASSKVNVFKGVSEGSCLVSVSYDTLNAPAAEVSVTDPNNYRVNVNYSGLPREASIISYQFYRDGRAVSEVYIKDSAARESFDHVYNKADTLVIFVKDSGGRLVGLAYKTLSFKDRVCVLNNVSVKQGTDMGRYIDSFGIDPEFALPKAGEAFSFTAEASFKLGGRINIVRDVTSEIDWSGEELTADQDVPGRFTAEAGGEYTAKAALAGKEAEGAVYVSGLSGETNYKYGAAESLSENRMGTLISYGPKNITDEGSASGKITIRQSCEDAGAAEPAARNSLLLHKRLSDAEDASASPDGRIILYDLPQAWRGRIDARIAGLRGKALSSDLSARSSGELDYVNAATGDVIEGLHAQSILGAVRTLSARVMLSGDDSGNSGQVMVLAELVNEKPVITAEQAAGFDALMGGSNPFDKDGKAILTRVRESFGHEFGYGVTGSAAGGMDKTEKVIFLFVDPATLSNGSSIVYGYQNPEDAFPKRYFDPDNDVSNEAEMLYLNPGVLTDNPGHIYETAAHEFQHLINFNEKYVHDGRYDGQYSALMLNEGAACLSSILCGFGLNDREEGGVSYEAVSARSRASAYLQSIRQGNIKEFDTMIYGTGFSYGQGLTLMSYFYDRFGLEAVKAYTANNYSALGLGDDYDVLAYAAGEASGENITFAELFRDFGMACVLSDAKNISGSIPEKYRLKTVVPGKTYNGRVSAELKTVKPVTWDPDREFSVPNIVPWSNGWYLTPDRSESPSRPGIMGIRGVNELFGMIIFSNDLQYKGIIE